jgi:hypothetical protein
MVLDNSLAVKDFVLCSAMLFRTFRPIGEEQFP